MHVEIVGRNHCWIFLGEQGELVVWKGRIGDVLLFMIFYCSSLEVKMTLWHQSESFFTQCDGVVGGDSHCSCTLVMNARITKTYCD